MRWPWSGIEPSLVRLRWCEFKRYQMEGIKYIFKNWWLWEFMGLRFFWEKIRPPDKNAPEYRMPVTIGIWIISFYIGIYTFSIQRYERYLNRCDLNLNNWHTRMAAGGGGYHHGMFMDLLRNKIPIKPIFYKPIITFESLLFPLKSTNYGVVKYFENYDAKEFEFTKQHPEIYGDQSIENYIDNYAWEFIESWNLKMEQSKFSFYSFSTVITKANYRNSEFYDCIIGNSGSKFIWSDFSGSSFDNCFFNDIEILTCNLSNTTIDPFSDRRPNRIFFGSTNLSNSFIINVNFGDSTFKKVNLKNATLLNVDLSYCYFESCEKAVAMLKEAKSLYATSIPIPIEKQLREEGFGYLIDTPPEDDRYITKDMFDNRYLNHRVNLISE